MSKEQEKFYKTANEVMDGVFLALATLIFLFAGALALGFVLWVFS